MHNTRKQRLRTLTASHGSVAAYLRSGLSAMALSRYYEVPVETSCAKLILFQGYMVVSLWCSLLLTTCFPRMHTHTHNTVLNIASAVWNIAPHLHLLFTILHLIIAAEYTPPPDQMMRCSGSEFTSPFGCFSDSVGCKDWRILKRTPRLDVRRGIFISVYPKAHMERSRCKPQIQLAPYLRPAGIQ